VFFPGVLYHLRHPLPALDLLADTVDRLLVLTTPGDERIRTPSDERRDALLAGAELAAAARPG